MSRDPAYLIDILLEARRIQKFTLGIDQAEFERDDLRQYAVVRCIEIIGEATRRLSQEFRANHPDIPWKEIACMRSKLIHDYDQIDLKEVWKVIRDDIPALIMRIEPLVPPDEN